MSKLVKIVPEKGSYVSIVWQVSDVCNFRCPYCSEYNWGARYKNNDFQKISPGLLKIFEHYKSMNYENFKIFFSGGEPSYWPPLHDVIRLATETLPKVKFAVNTNLSRDIDWWKEHGQKFDDIICSFHISGADQEKFMETYRYLSDKTNYLVARMMMQEDRFDEVIDFAEKFKQRIKNYKIEYVPIFRELSNTTEPWEYREERHREFLMKHGFERSQFSDPKPQSEAETASKEVYEDGSEKILNSNRIVAERRNFFAGWRCKVQESIFINPQGNITMATCGQPPSVGNLYDLNFSIPAAPITCRKLQCHCGTDISITKEMA